MFEQMQKQKSAAAQIRKPIIISDKFISKVADRMFLKTSSMSLDVEKLEKEAS